MARVYTCGFELGRSYSGSPYEFTGVDGLLSDFLIGSGPLSTDGNSTYNYNSNYGLAVGYDSLNAATRMYVNMYDTPPTTDHYFAFDFAANAAGQGNDALIWTQPAPVSVFTVYPWAGTAGEQTAGATGSTFSLMLRPIDNFFGAYFSYQLDLRDSTGATAAVGTTLLYHNNFYRIELGFKYNTGGTTGTVTMYINDVIQFDSVPVTSTNKDKVCSFSAGPERPGGAIDTLKAQCVFDNIRVNDNTGATGINTTYPGEGYIIHCLPVKSDISDWSNSAGNSTNNFSYVDDGAAAADPTVDYVQRTTTGAGSDTSTTIGSVTIAGRTEKYGLANSSTSTFSYPWNVYSYIPDPSVINLAVKNVGIGTVNGSASNTNSSTRGCVSFLAQGSTRWYSLDNSINHAKGYTDQTNAANYGQDWSINGYGANYDDANTSKVGNRPGLLNFVTSEVFSNMNDFWNSGATSAFGVRAFANSGNTIRLAYIWLMVEYTFTEYISAATGPKLSETKLQTKKPTFALTSLNGSGL